MTACGGEAGPRTLARETEEALSPWGHKGTGLCDSREASHGLITASHTLVSSGPQTR